MRQAETSTMLQEKESLNHNICSWEKQWYNSLKAWLKAETSQEREKILSRRRHLLNHHYKNQKQTGNRTSDTNLTNQTQTQGFMDKTLEAL